MEKSPTEISIILPCLNEQESIGKCINEIKETVLFNNLNAELIIVDNGSTDNSCKIVRESSKGIKTKLIHHPIKGYGSAYLKGFENASGEYIFMADSDGSYDFKDIPRFISELKNGYDFVIGNRFKGVMEKNAMPLLHKHIGNPILSWILRLFYNVKVKDAHCGVRAITKYALQRLNLNTLGMEFASEMIIKAGKNNLRIKEIPVNYYNRKGDSKLRSFRDGWRHLRFMLLYSPLWLFFIPGIFLLSLGIITMILFQFNIIFQINENSYHPMFISVLLILTGYQLIIFGLFAKTYAITHLNEKPIFDNLYKYLTIEKASITGILVILSGILIYTSTFINWILNKFNPIKETKKSLIALTLIILGIQSIFSSFMLSILGIREKQ